METIGDNAASLENKKGMFIDRLKQREEERLAKNQVQQQDISDNSNRKHIINFEAQFQSSKSEIMSLLSQCEELSSVETASRKHMDEIALQLQNLTKLVADAQLFLTRRDKQVANEVLAALQESLHDKQSALLPKKKFAFKMRKKENDRKLVAKDEPDRAVCSGFIEPFSECGFKDSNSEELVLSADAANGKDVGLHRLKGCTVTIYGNPGTVHVSGLIDCTVKIGPISTSMFVDDCVSVTFTVACQQLRIHRSSECIFYVHVTSRSIIEDSKQLQFAPYNWTYDDIDKHFALANINRKVNNWRAVDDFNWLALDVHSPNWSLLEPVGLEGAMSDK